MPGKTGALRRSRGRLVIRLADAQGLSDSRASWRFELDDVAWSLASPVSMALRRDYTGRRFRGTSRARNSGLRRRAS